MLLKRVSKIAGDDATERIFKIARNATEWIFEKAGETTKRIFEVAGENPERIFKVAGMDTWVGDATKWVSKIAGDDTTEKIFEIAGDATERMFEITESAIKRIFKIAWMDGKDGMNETTIGSREKASGGGKIDVGDTHITGLLTFIFLPKS